MTDIDRLLQAFAMFVNLINNTLPSFANQMANQRGRIYSIQPPPRIN